ncbi:GH12250 [Drosophila grimshawi]|uniref:GH12250 n=1 Tax=Drosophila grimshawi TaxID=7222 RepID=B4JJI3_DROGR|nr:GH12250 [Drosophila grimshawi]
MHIIGFFCHFSVISWSLQDHIRESKESKLDEMGRNSKARSRENISRQKHSQTSLQILDDVSNRYYREAVPISTQSSKADFKEKEHSILRRNPDMTQASLCGGIDVDDGESSSTTTATHDMMMTKASIATAPVNACDMGCQTRESLFANSPSAVATLMRQKSSSSSLGAGSAAGGTLPPPPPRFFSTFGYEHGTSPGMIAGSPSLPAATPPPPQVQMLGTMGRRSQLHMQHAPSQSQHESLELEERHSGVGGNQRSHYGLIVASAVKPQEICHHHHQHQQQQQQQLQQRTHHAHPAHQHQQQQQQQLQQQLHQQQLQQHQQQQPATRHMKGHGQTVLPSKSSGVAGKQQKNEESKDCTPINKNTNNSSNNEQQHQQHQQQQQRQGQQNNGRHINHSHSGAVDTARTCPCIWTGGT